MTSDEKNRTVIIAGGSGFLGVSLATHLCQQGFAVTILSRHAPRPLGNWRHVPWDARTLGDWVQELNGAAALINLTGRSVDCIKTPDHQDEILRSRVEPTRLLGQALRAIDRPPPVWVQMCTAHIYGDPPTAICSEESATGAGFAPFVAQAWEDAYHSSVLPQQRRVILRTSFVIGRDRGAGAGAMTRLSLLARLGLGGRVASGRQGFSWIHEADLNRLFERAIRDETLQGTYIASSPHPVSQHEFMHALRRTLGIPFGLPAASWMVRLAAPLLLRTDPELALYGRYVVPARLQQENFSFQSPQLPAALANLLRRETAPQRVF